MQKKTVSIAVLTILAGTPLFAGAANGTAGEDGASRPVTSREIDQLKREMGDASRSSVEAITEYHNESGDVNNRLDFWRYGARLNYKWRPNTMVYLRGTGTSYLTLGDVLNERGVNLTFGLKSTLSDAVETQFEVGGSHFSSDGSTVNALGSIHFKSSGGSGLYLTGSRTNVEESLLSAAGIRPEAGPFAGRLVGAVMDNRAVVGGRYKLTDRFDVFGEGGGGARTGKNIESNVFKVANAGAGYNLVATSSESPLSLLRASYSLDYFGFDKDLLGYGGVSLVNGGGRLLPPALLGADGVSPVAASGHPGVGGYFSPQKFVGHVGRIELQGRPARFLEYRVSGFIGGQYYTAASTRQANGFFGSVVFRLSDRFSVPVTFVRDNFGPFTQQTLFINLAVKL